MANLREVIDIDEILTEEGIYDTRDITVKKVKDGLDIVVHYKSSLDNEAHSAKVTAFIDDKVEKETYAYTGGHHDDMEEIAEYYENSIELLPSEIFELIFVPIEEGNIYER